MIRDDADTYRLACQTQHNRITDPGPAILSDPRSSLIQRRIDVDLFVVSLHRLHTVARWPPKWPTRGTSLPERSSGLAV